MSLLGRLLSGPTGLRCAGAATVGTLAYNWVQRPSHCERSSAQSQPSGKALLVASPAESKSEPSLVASPAESNSEPSLMARCLAEAIGTGIIVAGGCGSVCAVKYAAAGTGQFGLSAAWGLSVALAVYTTRAISGAHLNPAVTCALTAIGKSAPEDAAPYIGAQCLGAFVAGLANYCIFSAGIAEMEAAAGLARGTAASTASFAGAFGMVPNTALLGAAGCVAAEVYMTAILMFLILGIGDADSGSVPAAAQPALVGATVATLICTFGPVTGCGMNPARDLGPRLVTLLTGWGAAAGTAWYCYTVGPVIGAVLGAYAYQELMAPQTAKKQA